MHKWKENNRKNTRQQDKSTGARKGTLGQQRYILERAWTWQGCDNTTIYWEKRKKISIIKLIKEGYLLEMLAFEMLLEMLLFDGFLQPCIAVVAAINYSSTEHTLCVWWVLSKDYCTESSCSTAIQCTDTLVLAFLHFQRCSCAIVTPSGNRRPKAKNMSMPWKWAKLNQVLLQGTA